MTYFILSPKGGEYLNELFSPDTDSEPDHLRRGARHGYNTSCVKQSSKSEQWFLSYGSGQTDRQTDMSHSSGHFPISNSLLHSIVYTIYIATHLARSDTPSITCVVARLSRSDTPTLLWRPSDQWQGSTRAARERRPQGLTCEVSFMHLKLAVT